MLCWCPSCLSHTLRAGLWGCTVRQEAVSVVLGASVINGSLSRAAGQRPGGEESVLGATRLLRPVLDETEKTRCQLLVAFTHMVVFCICYSRGAVRETLSDFPVPGYFWFSGRFSQFSVWFPFFFLGSRFLFLWVSSRSRVLFLGGGL